MVNLEYLLAIERKRKFVKLTKTEEVLVNYLLKLKGERLFIENVAKETGLGKPTIYKNLENLKRNKLMSSLWKINPFALGFQIVEIESKMSKIKRENAVKSLIKHHAVLNIRRDLQGNLLVEVVVKDFTDFSQIKNDLEKMNIDIISSRIIIEKIFES